MANFTPAPVSDEIHDIADQLYGAGPAYQRIAHEVTTVTNPHQPADRLAHTLLRLTGPDSVLAHIALHLEQLTESDAINQLPAPDRHAVKNALAGITHDLTRITHSERAAEAAWHLDPA